MSGWRKRAYWSRSTALLMTGSTAVRGSLSLVASTMRLDDRGSDVSRERGWHGLPGDPAPDVLGPRHTGSHIQDRSGIFSPTARAHGHATMRPRWVERSPSLGSPPSRPQPAGSRPRWRRSRARRTLDHLGRASRANALVAVGLKSTARAIPVYRATGPAVARAHLAQNLQVALCHPRSLETSLPRSIPVASSMPPTRVTLGPRFPSRGGESRRSGPVSPLAPSAHACSDIAALVCAWAKASQQLGAAAVEKSTRYRCPPPRPRVGRDGSR